MKRWKVMRLNLAIVVVCLAVWLNRLCINVSEWLMEGVAIWSETRSSGKYRGDTS